MSRQLLCRLNEMTCKSIVDTANYGHDDNTQSRTSTQAQADGHGSLYMEPFVFMVVHVPASAICAIAQRQSQESLLRAIATLPSC